ncbi:hypothetical protein [Laspinema olomoucense]|nr:hypothetical protein [Laspinema sp. D3d]MCT7972626.1 hypothetical protein [Laspinema sp. D3d]
MAIEDSTEFLGAIAAPLQILGQIGKVMRARSFIPLHLKSATILFYITV